jgi:large subunit ribosomal protein L4
MSPEQGGEQLEFKVPSRGPKGEDLGELTVPASCTDSKVRYRLLKQATVMYSANSRLGTHETKTRGQLAGTNRKPWRQKGTGRARAGTRKSPIWRGGGTVFGPHPRDYSYQINKKQRRLALASAVYEKLRSGRVVVLEGLVLEGPRTKAVVATLKAVGIAGSCILGTAGYDRNLYLSARNLHSVTVLPVGDFNAKVVTDAQYVVLTRPAFDALCGSAVVSAGSRSDGAVGESPDAATKQETDQ